MLASVLFISLAQYANISTSSPREISYLVENRCENETSGMKRLFAKRKKALIDIAIKRWAFSIKWKENYFNQMKEIISFKWQSYFIQIKRLLHSNEKDYFIQMRKTLFRSHEKEFILFKWAMIISFKWEELFNSNERGFISFKLRALYSDHFAIEIAFFRKKVHDWSTQHHRTRR